MTPVDIARLQEAELNHLNQESYKYGATPHRAPYNAPTQRATPQDDTDLKKAPHDAPDQDGTTAPQRTPPHIENLLFMDALQDDPQVIPSPPRRITRHSYRPNRLEYNFLGTPKGLKHASVQVKSSQYESNRVNSY